MAAEEITIPEAPKHLPASVKAEWRRAYAAAMKKAQADYPEQKTIQTQFALREANRLLQVPEPKSYKDADALPNHHVVRREVVKVDDKGNHELRLVTSDGKKYKFPAPAPESVETK